MKASSGMSCYRKAFAETSIPMAGEPLLVLLLLLGLLGVAGHGWGLLGECLGFFHQDRPLFGDREFAVEGWGAFAGFDADGYA